MAKQCSSVGRTPYRSAAIFAGALLLVGCAASVDDESEDPGLAGGETAVNINAVTHRHRHPDARVIDEAHVATPDAHVATPDAHVTTPDASTGGGTTDTTANQTVPTYVGGFAYGVNAGYYNTNLTDQDVYQLGANAGATATRNGLWDSFLQTYGNTIRTDAFSYFFNTLGFRNSITMLGGPASTDQDTATYTSGTTTVTSELWKGMYQPIWTDESTGTVNPANTFAVYVSNAVKNYGGQIGIYEIVNEPDFTYNWSAASSASGTTGSWFDVMPDPADLTNVQAPITNYIRVLHIAYSVIKHFQPNAYVAPGGISSGFLDCLLRYTDNPTDGSVNSTYPLKGGAYFDAVTWHIYPEYADYYWNNAINGFTLLRFSDELVQNVRTEHNAFQTVLTARGYNGTTYPKKIEIMSEGNISRVQIQTNANCSGGGYECTGGTAIQENFTVKALVEAQREGLKGWYWYATGEVADAAGVTASTPGVIYDSLMGFYNNLTNVTMGNQVMNTQGITHLTTSKLLAGYTYNATLSATLAMPSTIDGGAFTNAAGANIYVLWAKTTTDNSEAASATYAFPTSLNLTTLTEYGTQWSSTNTTTSVSAKAVALTGAPVFLK